MEFEALESLMSVGRVPMSTSSSATTSFGRENNGNKTSQSASLLQSTQPQQLPSIRRQSTQDGMDGIRNVQEPGHNQVEPNNRTNNRVLPSSTSSAGLFARVISGNQELKSKNDVNSSVNQQNINQEETLPSVFTPGYARFCHECGTSYPTPAAKFCPECGERRVVNC